MGCGYMPDEDQNAVNKLPVTEREPGQTSLFLEDYLLDGEGDSKHRYKKPGVSVDGILRNCLPFKVYYNDGSKGNAFFLHNENANAETRAALEDLKKFEDFQSPWSTLGDFPNHSTGGEGYSWEHIHEYAKCSERMIQRGLQHKDWKEWEWISEDKKESEEKKANEEVDRAREALSELLKAATACPHQNKDTKLMAPAKG